MSTLPEDDPKTLAGYYFERGQYAEAALFMENIKNADPEGFEDNFRLAASWFGLGLLDRARALAAPIAAREATPGEATLLLGKIEGEAGDFTTAVDHLENYSRANPGDPEGLLELAIALEAAGRADQAEKLFRDIKVLHRVTFERAFERADVFFALDNARLAKRHLERAERIAPRDANIYFELGLRYSTLGMMNEAEKTFKEAIRLRPLPRFYGELASLYERANELQKAKTFAHAALEQAPDDPTLNLTLAKCDQRLGDDDAALVLINAVLDKTSDSELLASAWNLKGKILDKREEIDAAYQAFQASKDVSKSSDKFPHESKDIPYQILATLEEHGFLELPAYSYGKEAPLGLKKIVFFIGFPRSGTTLVQHILESHPGIVALDEKQVIRAPINLLDRMGGRYPEAIFDLTYRQARDLRALYLLEINTFAKTSPETVLVEKLPLNISSLPLIKVLFPEAKILFGLRHPLACSLSCLMQYFSLNRAMANMMSIDEITRFYAAQMSFWLTCERALDLDFRYIRYENVIANLEKETRELAAFLEIEWRPEMLSYAETARAKGIISTPSYSQVVKPLYRDSLERWRRYEKFFEPYKDRLEPFCRTFGYSC